MHIADMSTITDKEFYNIGENFSGNDINGRRIGFTNSYMQVDGRPFFGISGEMHFFRVAPDQWEDSIVKMKCCGINIISSYVAWIIHEEHEDSFCFDGCRNLRGFLDACEKHNVYVILRIGPFIHGEVRNGGLPDWLYGKPYEVREINDGFLSAVRKYFRALHEQMNGHYFKQGGCIIALQVDNEYESAGAPWETTTGISGEWVNCGHSGQDYLLAVKRIMNEEGMDTPFYTATAWGRTHIPVNEMLPLWGGYSYQPWLFYNRTGEHPATKEYFYRYCHNSLVTKEYNFNPTFDPESRPYSCCEMMGGMMCSYKYRFQLDMRAVDALANIKLGSGCNLLGYYMFRGGTNPLGLNGIYMNECQIPKRSYDYQAAIGEFGQIRESYGRLRALHMLCTGFSGFLEKMDTVVPGYSTEVSPEDTETLRYAIRARGKSGFLFINNFQDHAELHDHMNEEVVLRYNNHDVIFRFSIAAGENAILPFGIPLVESELNWATAQPLTHIGNTWFFFSPDGMKPRYCIDGNEFDAQIDRPVIYKNIVIMTISRKASMTFWNYMNRAWLCNQILLHDGNKLYVEASSGVIDLKKWNEEERQFVPYYYKDLGSNTVPVKWHKNGTGRYILDIPEKLLHGHKQVLLRIHYIGDIGNAFIDTEMISDNFCNNDNWDVRIDCYSDALRKNPLVILLTPIKKNVTIDYSAMAALKEHTEVQEEQLLSAEIVPVDDYLIPNIE